MKEFLRIVEMIKPPRFVTSTLHWGGLGRPMKDREKMLRVSFLKVVYDFPMTKGLIENLKTNPSLRRLCGWECWGEVPSEATFSRAFGFFAWEKVCDAIHAAIDRENYRQIGGTASLDSTAIIGHEKVCCKNTLKLKKKHGQKSIAEKAALSKQEIAEIKNRRLELQPHQTLPENLADLPQGCDWGGKRDSKGKTSYWCGYKLHLAIGDGEVPLKFSLIVRQSSDNPFDTDVFNTSKNSVWFSRLRLWHGRNQGCFEKEGTYSGYWFQSPAERNGWIASSPKDSLSGAFNGWAGKLGFERQVWCMSCQGEKALESPVSSDVRRNRHYGEATVQHGWIDWFKFD